MCSSSPRANSSPNVGIAPSCLSSADWNLTQAGQRVGSEDGITTQRVTLGVIDGCPGSTDSQGPVTALLFPLMLLTSLGDRLAFLPYFNLLVSRSTPKEASLNITAQSKIQLNHIPTPTDRSQFSLLNFRPTFQVLIFQSHD